ncbi:MAG: hypothetical protein JNL70_03660 [Saprospiraceae bacterium]|nr:hypothetical protein [Saprospiraceae bacterium]
MRTTRYTGAAQSGTQTSKIVWFATNSSGLIAFNTETNRFNVYDLKNKTP